MPRLSTLEARIKKLQQQAEALQRRERSGAVAKVLKVMAQYGLTVEDLPRRGGRKAAKAVKGVAKYRDPATGKTWTGHGRAPEWIKAAANRDDFLVDKSTATKKAPAAAKKASAKKRPAKKAAAAKKTRAPRKSKAQSEASAE